MKKTLSILIAVAMLASSAAYAAPQKGRGEIGTEKSTRAEQKNEKSSDEDDNKVDKDDKGDKDDDEDDDKDTDDNKDDDEDDDKDDTDDDDEFRRAFEGIKRNHKEAKAEAKDLINDLRDIFHKASKADRKEILDEIAQVKKELKDESIGMFMRGKHVDFDKYDGVKPEIVKDRTLIPLRAVSETLGAVVEWNDEAKTVAVTYNNSTIIVTVGSLTALVNGEEIEIDSPALIKKDRVLVPIRVIAEALGLDVEWDGESHSVIVDEKEPTQTPEPTVTAAPTETPEPTVTAVPTETPEPAETAAPTATPEPTETIAE